MQPISPNSSSPIGREILVTNYWKDKPEQRNGITKLKKALAKQTEDKKSDPQSLEGVRGDLYDHSVPGGGDGMAYAYGQCTWGVAARMNQLGLKLKGSNGEKISIINTMGNGQDWVSTASSLGETGSIPEQVLLFLCGRYTWHTSHLRSCGFCRESL